jgi:hypothetical protein
MASKRYGSLSRRIYELRRNLLPRNFDPLGLYSDRIYERTRGFRVLAHAEFESYIEDRCVDIIHRAHVEWKATGSIRPCLLSLIAHHEDIARSGNSIPQNTMARLLGSIPESLSDLSDRSSKHPTLSGKIETAKKRYTTYVRERNHGIKERNLLLLLLPLGVEKGEIDTTWLNTTEGWATERGTVAHTSAKMQVQVDPRSELNTVKQVLKGFQKVDGILEKK